MVDVRIQPFAPKPSEGTESKPKRSAAGGSFGQFLKESIEQVNRLQNEADKSIVDFATGKVKDIHQVMISVQKADISFRLMQQIRNKLVEAYREIMHMGI